VEDQILDFVKAIDR